MSRGGDERGREVGEVGQLLSPGLNEQSSTEPPEPSHAKLVRTGSGSRVRTPELDITTAGEVREEG